MKEIHMVLCFETKYIVLVALLIKSSLEKQISDEPDYSKLEFGGILHVKDHTASSLDSDVAAAVLYTHKSVKTRFPHIVPLQLNETKELLHLEKIKLVYSVDDEHPLYREDIIHGLEQAITKTPVIFGFFYKFKYLWLIQNKYFIHRFVVSVFPKNTFSLYSHTFYISAMQGPYQSEEVQGSDCKSKETTISAESKAYSQQNSNSQSDLFLHLDHCIRNDHWLHNTVDSCGTDRNSGFSVMTFNTWNMNGKGLTYVSRIKQLGKVLMKVQADIIGFQEVRYEHSKGGHLGPNQVAHLADMLPGYQFVFQPGQLQANSIYEGRTEEGVAIFSRFPILSTKHLKLFRNRSNSADTHQRVCLHAVIQHPRQKIHVLTTHLSLSHEAREKSVIEICDYIQQLHGPVIFLGDLNAEPNEPAMRYLRSKISQESKWCSGLIDTWLHEHGNESPGYTFNTLEADLSKRIDYIFLKKNSGLNFNITIPDDQQRGSRASSDHLPVYGQFTFHGV